MAEKHCTSCKTQSTAQTTLVASECEATRQHKVIRMVIIGWVITILLLFGSNLAWIVYESQFEEVYGDTVENVDIMQDTVNGTNNCVVNGGEICNG